MSEPVQHQPAIKVAGRRLSVTTKHKPHNATERVSPEAEDNTKPTSPSDYPRPTPRSPTEEQSHMHMHNQYEEDPQHKKEKKADSERKMQGFAQRKEEITRPTRDLNSHKTQNIRISQPAGKGLQV